MEKRLVTLKQNVKSKRKEYTKLFDRLKRMPKGEVDSLFHVAHDGVFAKVDCLTCANCCRTTGPLLTDKDIDRLANYFGMKSSTFEEKYLRIDEDGDSVFESMPCPFLGEDNFCSVYEFRPKACREYPHTDRRNMKQILTLTKKNASICPAVYDIIEEIKKELK